MIHPEAGCRGSDASREKPEATINAIDPKKNQEFPP
jgi:hypothetical protein